MIWKEEYFNIQIIVDILFRFWTETQHAVISERLTAISNQKQCQ